ncbi:MAG: ParB/RepB/Spo0J family partition protein, partial [Bacteroidales bacterium]|nr:ParB/RepB/Spo0J family partition protein [Bacteroidales bacterium]
MIPRSRLEPHPDNPRKDLGDLTELAASIKRSGLLQNLTVVPSPGDPEKYRIIIGHRRFAASEIAGLDELPCSIEEMDMPTQIATMIAENMQRNDLTLTDQVGGIQTMMDLGIDAKGIAERTGLSTTTVRKRMKLTGINPGLLADTVKKGATLMDLAEIANLDDDLRDQMLSEFGSTSFTWKMNQARETQKARKNIPKVREALSQWAKEVDQQPWNIYREACSHERSVELLHINENELKRPDAPQDTEFVFYINGSRCTVYRIGDKASAQMHEEQQRREQARNIIRTQELDV